MIEMPRTARCVAPGLPHHVTQRGNRRQVVFFSRTDYDLYKGLMRRACDKHGVRVWAYCLMPNHVHLILEPSSRDSLRQAVGWAHQCYTRSVNRRMRWTGYLWQGRFWSAPMDEPYLHAATRYILQNPVRAGHVEHPCEWTHSSTAAHLRGRDDMLVEVEPLAERFDDWSDVLSEPADPAAAKKLIRHSKAGLPVGSRHFVKAIEGLVGRSLVLRSPGRPRKG